MQAFVQLRVTLQAFASLLLLVSLSGCGTGAATSSPASQSPFVNYPSPVTQSIQATSKAPIPASYFGMHIHNLANPALPASSQTPFPSFPVATLRLWDNATWRVLEGSAGAYNWTRLDGTIQKAAANGTKDFVFTFGYVPQWASSNPSDPCAGTYPGSCDPPQRLSDLDAFADALVKRYCGVIKYYETWNEPSDPAFFNGTTAELLTITQHIHSAVKNPANCGCSNNRCAPGAGENPNKVLFPPIGNPNSATARQWLQDFLGLTGATYPYADIATLHGYGYNSDPEDIGNGVEFVRGEFSQHGLGSAELWNTEASWGNSTSQTRDEQAAWVIRYHLLQAISGVTRFMWYAYDDCKWGPLWRAGNCPNTTAQGPLESMSAYATVQHWLAGATLDLCEQHSDETWMCKIERPGGYVAWAIWNSNGAASVLGKSDLGGFVQYRNWRNGKTPISTDISIGPMPILLESGDQ